jgi:carboxynorspermidine decarboxylase
MRVGRSGMSNPTFILEKKRLEANLAHFEYLTKETGIKWLYTLKAFDKSEGLELIAESFDGFSIGNSNEYSKVKHHYKNLHSYAPAFYEDEVETLAQESTTMSFNSLSQWQRYANKCAKHCSLGLRINPHLILKQPSYCDSNISRLGIDYNDFLEQHHTFKGLEGLHFHALCHQTLPALEKLFSHIETHYKSILPKLKWLNLGGGQNFTDKTYDTEGFIVLIQNFSNKYPHLTLYFEPGSAVVHNCGYFECTVMDIIESDTPILILNTSIEAHLLDVAITKQKPKVRDTSLIKTEYNYELTGMSCIAGDVIGKYYFKSKLKVGDKIIFEDMLGYTIVKQTSFNGLKEVRFKIT